MSDVIKSSDKQAEARRQAKLQKEREERAAAQARFNRKPRTPRVAKEEKKETPVEQAVETPAATEEKAN